jgi:hypothetical protein
MATVRVSSTLLALIVQQHFPWPDGTVLDAIDDDPEGKFDMAFRVTAPGLSDGSEEVVAVFVQSRGKAKFDRWIA